MFVKMLGLVCPTPTESHIFVGLYCYKRLMSMAFFKLVLLQTFNVCGIFKQIYLLHPKPNLKKLFCVNDNTQQLHNEKNDTFNGFGTHQPFGANPKPHNHTHPTHGNACAACWFFEKNTHCPRNHHKPEHCANRLVGKCLWSRLWQQPRFGGKPCHG